MHPIPHARAQRGGFLLEALIGILIFAFGILGIVGLQAQSIKFTTDSQFRAEAVYLANSLFGNMWADDRAQLQNKYDKDVAGPGYVAFSSAVMAALPGGVPPDVQVDEAGPSTLSTSSSIVHITIFWQVPGESQHQYQTYGTVGQN